MSKNKSGIPIKVLIKNPPTKEQAEERIKKLSEYLGQIWNKPSNIK